MTPFYSDDLAQLTAQLNEWGQEERRRLHQGGELSMTFEAENDHFPMTLRDAAKAMTLLDRLLREIARSVDAEHPVEPLLTRVEMVRPKTQFTVVLVPRRPRQRRKR